MQDPNTPLSMEHYRGVYMLQEKVSRGKERVNVTKFDGSKDMSGEQPGGATALLLQGCGQPDQPLILRSEELLNNHLQGSVRHHVAKRALVAH